MIISIYVTFNNQQNYGYTFTIIVTLSFIFVYLSTVLDMDITSRYINLKKRITTIEVTQEEIRKNNEAIAGAIYFLYMSRYIKDIYSDDSIDFIAELLMPILLNIDKNEFKKTISKVEQIYKNQKKGS